MAIWPFRSTDAEREAQQLLGAVTEASRRPALFGACRIPDTLEGRFEAMALHGGLVMSRLRKETDAGALLQAFTDGLFSAFDAGLREAGVGDTAVPKRMHQMAGAFYGRLQAYSAAIEAYDLTAMSAAIGRNIFADEGHEFAAKLAQYALRAARSQAALPVEALQTPRAWPQLGG